MLSAKLFARVTLIASLALFVGSLYSAAPETGFDPTTAARKALAEFKIGKADWPQWGGSSYRNNTPEGTDIPTEWSIDSGENVIWSARLGSQTYGNPVVANGKIYVGTNNGAGYIKRFPSRTDLGCLVCFDETTGKFLWQHSNEKLPTGRVHDWPLQGVCAAPFVDGDRLWYISNRGEICCLDTEGFHDGENDGEFKDEKPKKADLPYDEVLEADVVWKVDMMAELGISQHNMCSCSVTAVGKILFVNTSNGVDEGHINLPRPSAPSFLALDRHTGKILWTDNTPGSNVLHGQWSSPCYGVLGGEAQVIFGAGDGWIYSFAPEGAGYGEPKMLWKFDANPKESRYELGGRATRNHIIGTPVIYDGLVYVAVGEDPEHGEGVGHLWCIDPTKRGDISPEIVYNAADPNKAIPHKRLQALEKEKGDFSKPNPNAAAVWHYSVVDSNKNGKNDFEETMHRTIGSVAIKNDILFIADFSGLVHCLDAKTGIPHWTHDMLQASWGSPLIVDNKVYIGGEDGDVTIFDLSKEYNVIGTVSMGNSVYSTPVVANNILYIANKDRLYAIKNGAKSEPPEDSDGGDSSEASE